jgi:hypothetical protein
MQQKISKNFIIGYMTYGCFWYEITPSTIHMQDPSTGLVGSHSLERQLHVHTKYEPNTPCPGRSVSQNVAVNRLISPNLEKISIRVPKNQILTPDSDSAWSKTP